MKRFKNGDVLIGDKASYFLDYDSSDKNMSVLDCIQDAKVAEMALLYLYGVICKGKKTDSVMFLARPFNNDELNMTFENIVNELKRREGEGNGDT